MLHEAAVDELTDDALAGDYRVFQRRRGHRYSLDDVATAWEAARLRPGASRVCDLGCGIGSVLLMVAHKLPSARLVGVEAQEVSFDLVRRNVERNAQGHRVTLIHGDLRDPRVLNRAGEHGPFELVTGTPPYMPREQGSLPPDPQRAHARMELRGGVEDYLRSGAALLAPGGRLVVCASTRDPERVPRGASAAGLTPLRARDVVPRAGTKGALFTLWTLASAMEVEPAEVEVAAPLVARDERGARTSAAHGLRRFFDLPVNEQEAASP